MARYGLLIFPSRCTGCNACVIACQAKNGLPSDIVYNRLESHIRGTFPNVGLEILPMQCMHCDNAPCISVCPTQASYKREDGIVAIDHNKCIGCKYCMTACPYDVRMLDENRVPIKCTWCLDDLSKGLQPACAATCMNEVRIFGDLDDPNSKINKLLAKHETYQIFPEKGTQPRIFYVKQ